MSDETKKADKCAGVSGPVKAGGLFGMLGGDGSCTNCGNSTCTCNNTLTEHLKKCSGYGTLPPLIEKCEDIPGPGFRDRCPRSTCSDADKQECFACGKAPKEPVNCEPPPPEKQCIDDSKKSKDGKPKCPPMPVTDCTDCKPAWMSCPPSFSTKTYPAPEGVEILPISIGGRNGRKSGACGKCGEKKSSSGKPKVSSNCPMMKAKCPGIGSEDVGGFFAKLTALFGGKAEKTPLEQVCEKLKVEDEQIRHHRDVFNPELLVRKDGYMCPFFQKVECAGINNCEAKVEEDCGCPEIVQEEQSVCEESVQEEECGCEESIQEEPLCEKTIQETTKLELESDDCNCNCASEIEENNEQPSPAEGFGVDEDEDEECIEDEEGECVRQEDDEESEPEVEIPDFQPSGKCSFEPMNQMPPCCQDCMDKGQNCCTPMSNFVIRVQAPFSDGSYQSCEAVLEKLCKSRSPEYPEPESRDETKQNCGLKVLEISLEPPTCIETPKSNCPCKEEAVPPDPPKTISGPCIDSIPNSEKPSPPCPPVKMIMTSNSNSCSSKPEAPSIDTTSNAPLTVPLEKESINQRVPEGGSKCSCTCDKNSNLLDELPSVNSDLNYEDVPTPIIGESKPATSEWNYEATPLSWNPSPPQQQCPIDEPQPDCTEVKEEPSEVLVDQNPPRIDSIDCPVADPPDSSAVENNEAKCEESTQSIPESCPEPPQQRKCTGLSAEERCRIRLENIICGCPKCVEGRGDNGPPEITVPAWSAPVSSPCTHCGAMTRGDNESCVMCNFTRRARDPYRYDVTCPSSLDFKNPTPPPCPKDKNKCNSDVFDVGPDGKPLYEGGMCLTRANYFLMKANPSENSLKQMKFENECFDGFRPARGGNNDDKPVDDCPCDKSRRGYNGGMSIDECKDFNWKASSSKEK